MNIEYRVIDVLKDEEKLINELPAKFHSVLRSIEDIEIRHTLILYPFKTKQLDQLFKEITEQYCAYKCERDKDVGCCERNYWDSFVSNDYMKELQRIDGEAYVQNICIYHNNGCILEYYKPMVCIGRVCDGIVDKVKEEYGRRGREFVDAVRRIDNNLGMMTIQCIDEAIDMGRELVKNK